MWKNFAEARSENDLQMVDFPQESRTWCLLLGDVGCIEDMDIARKNGANQLLIGGEAHVWKTQGNPLTLVCRCPGGKIIPKKR